MVRRCGHTCRTIRGVDGLSPSTLFFRGKLTPSAARRSGRPPGVLPRPAGGTPSRGAEGISLKVLKTCARWSKKLPIPLTPLSHCAKRWSKKLPHSHQGLLLLGQGFQKPHILTTFCSKNATSTHRTFTKLYSPVENLEAFLRVKFHLSSSSGTYLSANPRWLFWGRGSENRTFWALFAPKTQLLLGAPSPNYTDHLIWARPSFMWNSIALAPREHTPALTLGASWLTLVHALTRKPLGQSSSNSLCIRDL